MKKQTVHLQDALDTSSTTCLVHTVDTDVVVISGGHIIGKFHVLTANHPAADIIYGMLLVLVKTSCIYTSIQSAMSWEEISQWRFPQWSFPLFTALLDVIQLF